MKINKKNGFSLVELIVVIAIFSIISATVMIIFQYTSSSFNNANLKSEQQFETRMSMDLVKKEISIAKNILISGSVPNPLPANGGYCYYDDANHYLILRTIKGNNITLLNTLPDTMVSTILFTAVSINGTFRSVNLDWTIGDYYLTTDVYIQNTITDEINGKITSYNDISGTPVPGIYIEFS